MNKMILSVLLASTVMFSGAVNAAEKEIALPQNTEHVEIMKNHKGFNKDFHEKMAKKMAQDLNLTDEQQAQAKKIREEGRKKIKPLMDEMKSLRKKIDKERKANMEEFEKILTTEQQKKFDEMQQQFLSKFKEKMGENKHFDKKGPFHKMRRGMHETPNAEK